MLHVLKRKQQIYLKYINLMLKREREGESERERESSWHTLIHIHCL